MKIFVTRSVLTYLDTFCTLLVLIYTINIFLYNVLMTLAEVYYIRFYSHRNIDIIELGCFTSC